MSQEGKSGRDLVQVGRDYIQKTIQIVFPGFDSFTSVIAYPCRWVKELFEKDRIIRKLKTSLQDKQYELDILHRQLRQLQEVQNSVKEAIEFALNAHRNSSEEGIKDQSYEIINRLYLSLNDINRQNKEKEPYFRAAQWFQRRSETWLKETVDLIAVNFPQDIRLDEKECFFEDLNIYFRWLEESMSCAKPKRKTLERLNDSRKLPLPHPYREAFKHIRSKVNIKDMPLEEVHALHNMIDYIIENL